MNIVSVKHPNGGEKEYWFEVPGKIVDQVKKGSQVICATAQGPRFATATSDVISGQNVEQIVVRLGAQLPLRKVIKVITFVPTNRIKVPWAIKTTKPSPTKIAKRVKEFYDCGEFDTDVVVDENWKLIDGYTAYLVARMFGLEYLEVRVPTR